LTKVFTDNQTLSYHNRLWEKNHLGRDQYENYDK